MGTEICRHDNCYNDFHEIKRLSKTDVRFLENMENGKRSPIIKSVTDKVVFGGFDGRF